MDFKELEKFWIEYCNDNGIEDEFFGDHYDEALEAFETANELGGTDEQLIFNALLAGRKKSVL